MVMDALRQRRVELTPLATVDTRIDEFMTAGDEERPWQVFELTQSQNVEEWIKAPEKIETIQANLADFASVLKKLPNPVKVLDAGCYGGYLYDYLAKYVYSNQEQFAYTGIDVQEKAVQSARAMHASYSNCDFSQCDIYSLTEMHQPGSFDIAFCSRVLIHIPYLEKAISNLLHVAGSAVVAVLRIEDKPTCTKYLEKDLDDGHEVTYFVRTVSREMIDELAGKLHFKYKILNNNCHYSTLVIDKTRNLDLISRKWFPKIPLLGKLKL